MIEFRCDTCGGPGWFFGGEEYPLGACATCNDEEEIPRPQVIFVPRLSRPPEPWIEGDPKNALKTWLAKFLDDDMFAQITGTAAPRVDDRLPMLLSRVYYECAQCGTRAGLHFLAASAGWWACLCLAAAETAAGTVVLKFPQPVWLV